MRQRIFLHLMLCIALTTCEWACRDAHPQTVTDDDGPSQTGIVVEDSGHHLDGNFVVQSLADDYVKNSAQTTPRWAFRFKDDGTFHSERESQGGTRVEEGSYIIGTQNELVLYIENVSGEALSYARIELYKIDAQSDVELKLRHDGSATLVLHKQ
jgi:hypothetical protein